MRGFTRWVRLAVGTAVCSCFLFVLPGCATVSVEPADAKVPGITQLLSAEPGKSLDLFVVHGMCHHDKAWATRTLDWLGRASGGVASPIVDASSVAGVAVYSRTIEIPSKGQVRAHALVWSALTKPLKDRLCYDRAKNRVSCELPPASSSEPYLRYRDLLNRMVKETLVDDCFSDAVVYIGQSRESIQARIQDALAATRTQTSGVPMVAGVNALRASLVNDAGMVVLSSSLGSKLVFDAIDQMSLSADPDRRAAGHQLWNSMRGAFMAANQIPLLSLAEEDSLNLRVDSRSQRRAGEYAPDPLAALLANRQPWNLHAQGTRPPMPIVAFTDPNDLLSFEARPFLAQRPSSENYYLVDVLVRNARSWGLIANPWTAHTHYLDNEQVLKVLFHGINTSPEALRSGP